MLNRIIITRICNLSCTYCIAKEFFRKEKEKARHMNVKEFQEIVNFITRSHSNIQISGGDPTMHPKVREIFDWSIKNEKIKNIAFLTNAIYLEKVMDQICHRKVHVGVSLNSPKSMGKENYKKTIKNLDELYFKKYNDRFSISINMFRGLDYEYLIEALKRYNKKSVGTSIVLPFNEEARNESFLDYCKSLKNEVLEFFEKLHKEGIKPIFRGPTSMPPCVYTKKELKFLNKYLGEKISFSKCGPNPEFVTGKKVIRCLPLAESEEVDMYKFQNVNEIAGYFMNRYDSFMHLVPIDERCRECVHMHTMQCFGGCMAYRIGAINQARNMIQSLREVKNKVK